jgi:hypothetical protein
MSSIFSMKNAIARSLGNLMGIDDAGGVSAAWVVVASYKCDNI